MPDPSSLPSLAEINKGIGTFTGASTPSADAAAQVGSAMDQAGAAAASPEVLLAAVVAAGVERRCYTCLVIMRFAYSRVPVNPSFNEFRTGSTTYQD
jgi:hypothetical protein